MSRTVLVLDVETTGLDPKVDRVIELGWCLYDADGKRVVHCGGEFVSHRFVTNFKISQEIQDLTGIDPSWVDTYGREWHNVLSFLPPSDFYAAHNAVFDRSFIDAANATVPAGYPATMRLDLTWIDTRTDLPFVKQPDSRKLKYLALDHGIPPTLSHRAMFDAVQTALLLGKYDFDKVLERAKSPNVTVRALVSYDDREKAKTLGFYWKPDTKQWLMDIKEIDRASVKESAKAAGFEVAA